MCRPLWSASLTGPVARLSPGLDGVEQRALAHARRTGDQADPARQPIAELVDALPGLGARVQDRVADLLVGAEQRPGRVGVAEVELVGDDHGRDLVVLGNHQEAVDHPHVGDRIGAGEDRHQLVEVGDHEILLPRAAVARLATREPAAPWRDLLDHALRIGQWRERHLVADDDQVLGLALALEAAAELALVGAGFGCHGVEPAARAQHGPGQGGNRQGCNSNGCGGRSTRSAPASGGSGQRPDQAGNGAPGRRERDRSRTTGVVIGASPFACGR